MTRPILLLLFLTYGVIATYGITIKERDVKEALERLDKELSRRQMYIDERQNHIDSVKKMFFKAKTGGDEWYRLAMDLGDSYTSFNTDSALIYYYQGYEVAKVAGDSMEMKRFCLQHSVLLPLTGLVNYALEEYNEVTMGGVPDGLKELYYDSGRQMYSYISSFYVNTPDVSAYWKKEERKAQAELIVFLDPETPKYKLNQGEYYYTNKEYSKAEAILEELLERIPESSNIYARACHMLSDIAKVRKKDNEYLYYLTLSAMADVKSATLEVMSLQELGRQMFEQGETERAHKYLSIALDNAVKCHAMARMVQSSEALPIIEGAHALDLKRRDRTMLVFIGLMVLLIVLLIVMLVYLRKEMQHMKTLQGRLEGANHVKEVYITQFLSLCSIYMDKLNQFCKIANRKISAGKVEDLYKMTKSGKFIEEQSAEFYNVFDNAFLHIYPTFVKEVNDLLRPDEQIELQPDELLNTDLRILAFMRLGIEESPRIAQLLNYSVYTIYAYRNKLRNRAIDRENFEKDVMRISSIS